MSRRTVTLLQVLVVFLVPMGWLMCVATAYGVETHPFSFGKDSPGRVQLGAAIGCIAGLCAGWAVRRGLRMKMAFVGMVLVAGLNSWGVMWVVVGINSTSGYGIDPSWVWGTVASWLLAFVAFFSSAWLVGRPGKRTADPVRS